MKRKTIVAISTLLVASSLFASCSSGGNKVSFGEYWYKNASISASVGATETVSYDITFTKGAGIGKNYDIDYTNGEYTTTFSLVEEDGKQLYRLTSTLTIDVTYTFNGNSETFNDMVSSTVDFEKNVALTPIKSHKDMVTHSPKISNSGDTVQGCFDLYDYTVDVVYNGAAGVSTVTNNRAENSVKQHDFEIDDADDYNYLDNEQLLFALRGLQPTATTTSNTFLVYAPFSKVSQKISTTFGSKVAGEKFTFIKNGESQASESTIDYYPISIELAESNPGSPQLVKIAATTSSKANVNRNMILEIQTPLSYNLGTLTYKVKSANLFE